MCDFREATAEEKSELKRVMDDLYRLNYREAPRVIVAGGRDFRDYEMTKILFPASWKYHCRLTGFLRNEDMLSIATHLVAFWNGRSHGTKHMIDIAREKGITVWIFNY